MIPPLEFFLGCEFDDRSRAIPAPWSSTSFLLFFSEKALFSFSFPLLGRVLEICFDPGMPPGVQVNPPEGDAQVQVFVF